MRRLRAILLIIGAIVASLFLSNNSNHTPIHMHWMLLHPKLQPQAGSELPYMISDPQLNGLVYYDTFTRETLVLSRGQWYRVHSKVNPGIWFGGPAIAYDPMRKYLLLFGVKDRTVKGRVIRESQTWILSANGWRRIRTATSPPPLSGSSLGCDPVTGQCVLFGGIEPALSSAKRLRSVRFFTETWIWNGSTWKRIYTPHHPSAQLNAPVAWDSYTHQLVLFGGFPYPGDYYGGTWIWVGKSWHLVSKSPKPMPDMLQEPMTYDPNIKGLLLSDINEDKMQEWFWDGKAWKLLAPNFASPLLDQKNFDLQMQYDNADHWLVLYVRYQNKSGSSDRTYVLK